MKQERLLNTRVRTEPNVVDALLLEDVLREDRVEQRVELLSDALEQHRRAELDGVLECAHVVLVGQLNDRQLVGALEVLNPFVRLHLWVCAVLQIQCITLIIKLFVLYKLNVECTYN